MDTLQCLVKIRCPTVNKYMHILQLGLEGLLTYKHVYSGVWNLLCKWHVDTVGDIRARSYK